jgi:hypothetical protein
MISSSELRYFQNFENPMPTKHPFLFTRQNVRYKTEESDPLKHPEADAGTFSRIMSGPRKSTVSYTPSGGTLQLWFWDF